MAAAAVADDVDALPHDVLAAHREALLVLAGRYDTPSPGAETPRGSRP